MDEIVDVLKRQIILAVQCKDFGHTIDDEFRTTPVKIELLELACRDAARAALSALHDAGYRVVPNEPTSAIEQSGFDALYRQYQQSSWDEAKQVCEESNIAAIYRAMIAASPVKKG